MNPVEIEPDPVHRPDIQHRCIMGARSPVPFSLPATAPLFSRSIAGEVLPFVRMGNHRQRELLLL